MLSKIGKLNVFGKVSRFVCLNRDSKRPKADFRYTRVSFLHLHSHRTHWLLPLLSYPTISYDLWKSLDDPAARIDRVLQDRSHRLIVGLAINQTVSALQCVLMMTDGHGKFLRLRHVVGQVVPISKTIQDSWRAINASEGNPRLKDTRQFMSELADFQSQSIESVKLHAGKYVDRILAVALTDPGLWVEDFDGRRIYCPLSDSQRVADLTGLTVIDNFPAVAGFCRSSRAYRQRTSNCDFCRRTNPCVPFAGI